MIEPDAERERIYSRIAFVFGGRIPTIFRDGKGTTEIEGRYLFRYRLIDLMRLEMQMHQLVTAVNGAEKRIHEVIGSFPDKITIEICHSEAELPGDGTGPSHFPGWIGGSFDGTIRVLADPLGEQTPHTLYVFVTHEMVHAALAAIEGERLPCWFEEGLAVHMSQGLPRRYEDALTAALRARRPFSLAELKAPFTLLDEAQVPLAYAQATSVVEYMADKLGAQRFRAAIARAKRRGFLPMLKAESLTLSLLEQDWRRWASRRIGR